MKLYTIEIEGVSSSKLFKNIQTNNFLFHSGNGLKGYTDRLTEAEIKQKDERLWQFAKEVVP
jgi:cytoskeletal protein CcmA (bactofilin family)